MKHWESLVDQKIREAMERGEFDNLPGKGKPIDTSENPFEDSDLRMAHRVLRNAGFAPSWIEECKDIDAEFERELQQLLRVRTVMQNAMGTEHETSARVRWDRALTLFRTQTAALNQRIKTWNLKVPAPGFQRKLIDVETTICGIEGNRETEAAK